MSSEKSQEQRRDPFEALTRYWGRLTRSDLEQIRGSRDRLIARLSARYGVGDGEIEALLERSDNRRPHGA